MTENDVVDEITRNDLKRVECAVSDFTSTPRGKVSDATFFLSQKEMRLAAFFLGLTVTCREPDRLYTDFVPRTMPDVRFLPDWDTFAIDPTCQTATGTLLCDASGTFMSPLGEEMDCAGLWPRTVLKRVLKQLSDAGFAARVAPELEFALATFTGDGQATGLAPAQGLAGKVPHVERSADSFSLEAARGQAPFFDALWAACECLRIPVTGYAHEAGAGQYEVNFAPADPLTQADAVFRFKSLARTLGRQHGFVTTFLAKPYPDDTGAGMHWHVSLKDKLGNNPFAATAGQSAAALRQFVGGWQKSVRGATAIYAPYANSYFRYSAPDASPVSANWSYDNRAAAFRVPHSDAANSRIENRLPGADINPYLVLAVMLGTGLEGIQRRLDAAEPIIGVPNGPPIPKSLPESLDALAVCPILAAVLGRQFIKVFTMVKRFELVEQESLRFTCDHLLTRA